MRAFQFGLIAVGLIFLYFSCGDAYYFRHRYRYRIRQPKQTFTNCFGYQIEYNDPVCSGSMVAPSNLSFCSTHRGYHNNRNKFSSVISLMKKAVKMNGTDYMFSLLFADPTQGYEIHQINGTFSNDMCTWNAYLDDGENPLSSSNLLSCRLVANQTLVFRYEKTDNAVMPTTSSPGISIF